MNNYNRHMASFEPATLREKFEDFKEFVEHCHKHKKCSYSNEDIYLAFRAEIKELFAESEIYIPPKLSLPVTIWFAFRLATLRWGV